MSSKIKVILISLLMASPMSASATAKKIIQCGDITLEITPKGHYAFGVIFPTFTVIDQDGRNYEAQVNLHSEGGNVVVKPFRNNQSLEIKNIGLPGMEEEYAAFINNTQESNCEEK